MKRSKFSVGGVTILKTFQTSDTIGNSDWRNVGYIYDEVQKKILKRIEEIPRRRKFDEVYYR